VSRRHYFILARLLVAGLLFWSAADPLLRHYFALRLAVTAVGVWGIWRTLEDEDLPLCLFFFVLVVGPHLLYAAEYGPAPWAAAAASAGGLLVLSIALVDSDPLESLFTRSGWKRLGTVVTIGFGVAWIALGAALVFAAFVPISSIVRIKLDAREAQARITRVTHWVEWHDDLPYDRYRTEYAFETEDGTTVSGVDTLSDDPLGGASGDEFDEKYGDGYQAGDAQAVLLAVEYQAGNPANSRVPSKAGIVGALLVAVVWTAIGAFCGWFGFTLCKENGAKLRQ
jgi:hypothetical protein